MKFKDIKPLTRYSGYSVSVSLDYLHSHYADAVVDMGLNVDPDFQRGHVWTMEQKIAYVEYMLRGGQYGRDLWFNCPGWQSNGPLGEYVLVDGKQRLSAALAFMNNEVPVFDGHYRRDFTDRPGIMYTAFNWHVNTLGTRDECLQWYIDLNRGGTPHTEAEINKVRALLGTQTTPVTNAERMAAAGMDRTIFEEDLRKLEDEKKRYEEARIARLNAPPVIAKRSKKRS